MRPRYKMERQIIKNLIESLLLTMVTTLVHSITLMEACTLTLLFTSVLAIARGVMYTTLPTAEGRKMESMEVMAALPEDSMVIQASKFYAVARGVRPGVYCSWGDCAPMVIGVKGAVYKSFPTREKAEEFLCRFR